jgi:hypothetical protein
MAVYTIIRFFDGRRVVTLGVELSGKFEYIPRAELNTIPASLTAIFQDIYNTRGNLNFFRIKRNPPKYHDLLSICVYSNRSQTPKPVDYTPFDLDVKIKNESFVRI